MLGVGSCPQSTIPSRNQWSQARSRNTRYVAPSLSVTSHSSRSHWELEDGCPSSNRPSPVHHAPDVRHGPAHCSTRPPLNPRRSVVTRDGVPCSTWTPAGTGNRNRPSALICLSGDADHGDREPLRG